MNWETVNLKELDFGKLSKEELEDLRNYILSLPKNEGCDKYLEILDSLDYVSFNEDATPEQITKHFGDKEKELNHNAKYEFLEQPKFKKLQRWSRMQNEAALHHWTKLLIKKVPEVGLEPTRTLQSTRF